MTDVTLFKPSGQAECKDVTDLKIEGNVITFYTRPNPGSKTSQKIITSVPFFVTENVGS